ncbi:hypothetical protein QL285_044109 [Trifolium repens]|nr:hypothetical protein QL285_044109 [Trifolium repens]
MLLFIRSSVKVWVFKLVFFSTHKRKKVVRVKRKLVKKCGSLTFDAFNIGAVKDVGGESSTSKWRRIEAERSSSSKCTQKALEEVESVEVEIVNGL